VFYPKHHKRALIVHRSCYGEVRLKRAARAAKKIATHATKDIFIYARKKIVWLNIHPRRARFFLFSCSCFRPVVKRISFVLWCVRTHRSKSGNDGLDHESDRGKQDHDPSPAPHIFPFLFYGQLNLPVPQGHKNIFVPQRGFCVPMVSF
jgi:hypothetical protein